MTGAASTNTWFARLFGINHFDVTTHANACSPCSSTPVDIVIAIDRTGSMCSPTGSERRLHRPQQRQGRRAARCSASSTRRTRRSAWSRSRRCRRRPPTLRARRTTHSAATATTATTAPTRGYLTDTINGNYKTGRRALNTVLGPHTCTPTTATTPRASRPAATPPTARRCARPRPSCSPTGAPTCPNYIVFLTDGEANIGSVYPGTTKKGVVTPDPTYPPGNADDSSPCHTAINLANAYKAAGMTIYSIGYALGSNVNCTRARAASTSTQHRPSTTARASSITPAVPAHCDSCGQTNPGCYHYAEQQRRESRRSPRTTRSRHRLARRLLQPADRRRAEHDLRGHRDRHRRRARAGWWTMASRLRTRLAAARRARRSSS